jgi:hypothetical protein
LDARQQGIRFERNKAQGGSSLLVNWNAAQSKVADYRAINMKVTD